MKQNRIIYAKNKEFEITDKEDPFKDDKLGRKQYAEALTDVVEAYRGGAVIALNGAWGTGKTTFLKMWKQHLENNGFPVVYYNAWEDDICEEPLPSMLRVLKRLDKEDGLDNVFKTGAKVIVGALFEGVVESVKVAGFFKGAIKGGKKQLEKEVFKSLDKENDRTQIMCSFTDSLIDYMTKVCENGKPLVYMVDELDRCNPSFAVKVLERIKHLFDVPNVVFVLSLDKKQLACSVKGFYGSNEIDADEYLRRFIDIEYYLPEPNAELFCEYLFDYYGFEGFLKNKIRLSYDYLGKNSEKANQERNDLLFIAKSLVKNKQLTLRQIERVFAIARIALCAMPIKSEIYPELFFLLSYLKICESELFDRIADFSIIPQGFVDFLEKVFTNDMIGQNSPNRDAFHGIMSIALACYFDGYNNSRIKVGKRKTDLFGGDKKLTVSFKHFDLKRITEYMVYIKENNLGNDIAFITQKLRLYDQMVYQDDSTFELPKPDPASVERLKEIYNIK